VWLDQKTGEWVNLPKTNIFEKGCQLIIAATPEPVSANSWKPFNSRSPKNGLLIANPKLYLQTEAQSIDQLIIHTIDGPTVTQTSVFSQFHGDLGAFEDPKEWQGARVEALLIAYSNISYSDDQWWRKAEAASGKVRARFEEFYDLPKTREWGDYTVSPMPVEAKLEIFVGGRQVASSSGWVAKVIEHDEDVKGLFV